MKRLFEYLGLTFGAIIVAAGLELILAPNDLVDGGVTALAIMARKANHRQDSKNSLYKLINRACSKSP